MAATALARQKSTKDKAHALPIADYCDQVTDEHVERIRALVPEDEHKDAKVVAGPAW